MALLLLIGLEAPIEPQLPASLGAGSSFIPTTKSRKKAEPVLDEIEEPIPVQVITRIQNEFLSESLAQDLIARAKARRTRDEESLLMLI